MWVAAPRIIYARSSGGTQTAREKRALLRNNEISVIVEKIKSDVTPACDAAVVAIVDGSTKPFVLFEYKPAVDLRKDSLGRQDLMEVLIQGYYCLYQHDVSSMLYCLTYLERFYYFKMEKAETRKMRISWNFSLVTHTHLSCKIYPHLQRCC